jgi:hypothetical protein
MEELQVLGVVSGSGEDARVAYVNAHVQATDELLALTAPLPPAQVLRLAAKCEEKRCTHFDGTDCRLAARIVASLAPGQREAAALRYPSDLPLAHSLLSVPADRHQRGKPQRQDGGSRIG